MLDSGYSRFVSITKSDTVDIDGGASTRKPIEVECCDAVYVGTAGVVVVVDRAGNAVSFTAIAGAVLPVQARRINSTNTVPSLMVALYR